MLLTFLVEVVCVALDLKIKCFIFLIYFSFQELTSERAESQKLTTQVAELNQSLEELENKLKMTTSKLEQLQAECARVVSEVTASPRSSGTGETEDSISNRQSPVARGSPQEAHSSSEDQIADSQVLEHAAIVSSSEDTKTPEGKKPQSPETNIESQHPVSEKLINLEKEVCITMCLKVLLYTQ